MGQNLPQNIFTGGQCLLTVAAPMQLFRFVIAYVYKAAHMSNTSVRHFQCSCQVHLFLYYKCIIHVKVFCNVLQVFYIEILE